MVNQRKRIVLTALSALVLVWVLAMTAYLIIQYSKVTLEKIHAYAESVDLSKLSAAERAVAIGSVLRYVVFSC